MLRINPFHNRIAEMREEVLSAMRKHNLIEAHFWALRRVLYTDSHLLVVQGVTDKEIRIYITKVVEEFLLTSLPEARRLILIEDVVSAIVVCRDEFNATHVSK